MAVKSKIVKQLHEAIDAVVADATDAQALAAVAFINSLVTDEDESEDEEEETVKKPKKGKAKPAKDEDEEEDEESDEDEDEEDESDEDEDEEDESEEEDEDEESDEEEEDEDSEDEEDESEDEESEDDEDEEDEKPAKKKPAKKVAASEDDEEEGRDYKGLNEKKVIAIFKEAGVPVAAYSKIKTNKIKLVKLLKAYDENVAELKGKSLVKLTALAKKQGVEVKFGRGRSNDQKKILKTAEALAAAALND